MSAAVTLDDLIALDGFSAPAFLPDGKALLCLGPGDGTTQAWIVPLDGSPRRRLSFTGERVMLARSNPAGDTVLFATDIGGDEHAQLWTVPVADGPARRLTDAPLVIHTFGAWAPDGQSILYASNRRDRARFDLYRHWLEGGRIEMLLEKAETLSVGGWQPGGSLVVLLEDHSCFDTGFSLFDLDTRQRREIVLADRSAKVTSTRWSRDGKELYFCADGARDFLGLGRYTVASGAVDWLHTPQADIESCALSSDGRIAVLSNHDGYSRLSLLDRHHRPRPGAIEPGGVITEMAWSPDAAKIAFAFTTPVAGSRIRLFDPLAGTLTAPMADETAGRLAAVLSQPELVCMESFDGLGFPSFYYLPRGTMPKDGWPCVMFVHGGPESQTRPNLRFDMQNMVEAGYALLMPNVRGSTGYGRRYAGLDDRERRMDSVRDLGVAGRWLAARPEIDATRIAIMGESYGGFMVLSALAEQPELWCAAVDIFGVVNFKTLLENTGPWRRDHRAAEYGDPRRDPDLMRWLSPISRADRIKAPLFVSHGDRDPRVPKSESDQIVAFLNERRGTVEYQEISYEGHGYCRAENRKIAYDGVRRFLDRHLATNR